MTTNSAQFWVESFIRQLVKITSVTHSSTTYLDIGDLVQNVRKTNNRLLIFGYDGSFLFFVSFFTFFIDNQFKNNNKK